MVGLINNRLHRNIIIFSLFSVLLFLLTIIFASYFFIVAVADILVAYASRGSCNSYLSSLFISLHIRLFNSQLLSKELFLQ